MVNLLRSVLALCFPMAGAASTLSPANAQDLPGLAESLAAHPAIPAAALGWVDADTSAFAVAGITHAGGRPVERGDAWHLGSITKSMTAFLAARMVAQGEITWDTPLGGPDGPDLAALLRHTSGLPANPSLLRMIGLPRDLQAAQSATRDDLVTAALSRRRADRGFLYSNLGFIAAGQMLAARADAEWESLMRVELFDPFGLQSAGFGAPDAIRGHNGRGRAQEPGPGADNPPAFGPAGTVHMAPRDILAYLRLHLMRDAQVLAPEVWAVLHEPLGDAEYAMGWMLREGGAIWHNGSNTFWYAEVFVDHATGRAGFVAVNAGNLRAVQGLVAEALAALNPGSR